jgi:hypothetical protein
VGNVPELETAEIRGVSAERGIELCGIRSVGNAPELETAEIRGRLRGGAASNCAESRSAGNAAELETAKIRSVSAASNCAESRSVGNVAELETAETCDVWGQPAGGP